MAAPAPAFGPLFFKAIRSLGYDLPEDFVTRLEPGLDERTKASLEVGMRIVRLIRRLWRWTLIFATFGVTGLFAAGFAFGLRRSDIAVDLLVLSLFLLGLGSSLLLYVSATAVAHRREIHRLEAFAKAMRGSSLARDLA